MMNNMTDTVKQLLILNILFFVGSYFVPQATDLLALHYFESAKFQLWQPLSHMFMHGNLMHIFFNMFALVSFGSALEHFWGPKKFLFFYFSCGIGAALIHSGINYYEIHSLLNELSSLSVSTADMHTMLNANMKDVDGSEKMYLELKGLGAFAQFKLKDGGIVESEYDSVNKVWTIKDIEFDKINDIQFTNDKDATVDIKAWTQDGIDSTREKPATGSMEIKYTDPAIESGKFTLGKEVNIDFSKIANGDIKGISKIDLGAEGENKLLNLTLQDVLDMGKKDGSGNINLTILGDSQDKVSFADKYQWKKSDTPTFEGGKTFTEWSNTGNNTVTVKVEQPISDGITN